MKLWWTRVFARPSHQFIKDENRESRRREREIWGISYPLASVFGHSPKWLTHEDVFLCDLSIKICTSEKFCEYSRSRSQKCRIFYQMRHSRTHVLACPSHQDIKEENHERRRNKWDIFGDFPFPKTRFSDFLPKERTHRGLLLCAKKNKPLQNECEKFPPPLP